MKQGKGLFSIFHQKVTGLEVTLSDTPDMYDFSLVTIKKSGELIQVSAKEQRQGSVKDILKLLPKSVPVCLTITGKGILTRKVEHDPEAEAGEIFHKVLPNAALKDFVFQLVKIEDGASLINIARKDTIDHILKTLAENKIFTGAVSVGLTAVNAIAAILSASNETVCCAGHTLKVGPGGICDYSYQPDTDGSQVYHLDEEEISSGYVIAFSTAMQFLLPDSESVHSNADYNRPFKAEFRYFQVYYKLIKILTPLVFIILIINFLLFTDYSDKLESITTQLGSFNTTLQNYDSLKVKLKEKEKFIEVNGLERGTKISFYADRLASLLPPGIMLDEMELFPALKKDEKNIKQEYLRNIIRISGITGQSVLINEWVNQIKKAGWVKDVTIVNFYQNNMKNRGEFIIEINLL